MGQAEYQRRRRKAAPPGSCSTCSARPALPSRRTCEVCSARQTKYRERRVAESRCRHGACSVPPAPGRSSCPVHLETGAARNAALKRKRAITKTNASAALALAEMRKGRR